MALVRATGTRRVLRPGGGVAASDVQTLLAAGPVPEGGAHLGLTVVDAASGEPLLDVRGGDAFTPASSQKLLVTSAVLSTLGPDFRFGTQVLTPPLAAGTPAHLTLRGEGDPSLTRAGSTNSLAALARGLRAAGVRSVGSLRVDDTAFAWPRWGSGWMWDDPAYPIGALLVTGTDAPTVALTAGSAARADLVTDPAAYPVAVGRLFQDELTRAGVEVAGGVARAPADAGDAVLAQVRSAPLAQLVRETNKASLNSHAEQLYARLGLEAAPVSTPESSLAVLGTFLAGAGVDIGTLRVRDGSGLSRYNLISPRQFARLLHHIYQNPVYQNPLTAGALTPRQAFDAEQNLLIASLPVAGAAGERGGTLAGRPVGRGLRVHAKTGTMTGVSSLTGYLRAASGRDLAFSALMDHYPGPTADLRRLQDALLEALARSF